ncbi:MAG: class I SAM-dependent methyltransferase [Gammaproteobacteria bacterium]|nr:class I SAM-dependent methyltransferase [Gammaproteobacteria bacterium]NBT45733.1 class I SAM-dependent methyltransferase [Gammaproteobacteria bacterium]
MDLKEEHLLGNFIRQHWYYQSKAKAVNALLNDISPSCILDVGAGSGYFSRHLLDTTAAKSAYCVDISYPHDWDEEHAGKTIHFRKSAEQVDADLVLFMDVLEHVEDDLSLLKDYMRKSSKGTLVLISVPAFQCLWSGHDVFLGHQRRYTLEGLQSVVRAAGLQIHSGSYYFALVAPIALLTRSLNKTPEDPQIARSQLQLHHPATNAFLKILCEFELPLIRFNRFAGLTAFVLAEKVSS